jgi:glutamine amidotransferase
VAVGIIDYGVGNLGSLRRAFEECSQEVVLLQSPKDLTLATHLVLPGVGSFAECMASLEEGGWVEALKKDVLEYGIPILGVCLGMHMLATHGHEGGKITPGLGFIEGEVQRLEKKEPHERIPHVGWNEVALNRPGHNLFNGIPDNTDFYFVHSYHFVPEDKDVIVATTPYCGEFVSVVCHKNIHGVQFHPEKSVPAGLILLQNFVESAE